MLEDDRRAFLLLSDLAVDGRVREVSGISCSGSDVSVRREALLQNGRLAVRIHFSRCHQNDRSA